MTIVASRMCGLTVAVQLVIGFGKVILQSPVPTRCEVTPEGSGRAGAQLALPLIAMPITLLARTAVSEAWLIDEPVSEPGSMLAPVNEPAATVEPVTAPGAILEEVIEPPLIFASVTALFLICLVPTLFFLSWVAA